DGGRKPISSARTPWKKALDHPGAFQVGYARRLLEARPFEKLVPDQSLVAGDPGKGAEHVRAARAADGNFALVYLPAGKPVTVDLGRLAGKDVRAWWFDPRDGKAKDAGTFPRSGTRTFRPPGKPGRGNDWVLVLEDAESKLPPPGPR